MTSIIEKPSREVKLKSNYSAVGRYVLSADIWPILKKLNQVLGAVFN